MEFVSITIEYKKIPVKSLSDRFRLKICICFQFVGSLSNLSSVQINSIFSWSRCIEVFTTAQLDSADVKFWADSNFSYDLSMVCFARSLAIFQAEEKDYRTLIFHLFH